jgi:oxygen-independent coproporphyrinogen-3 oxidase
MKSAGFEQYEVSSFARNQAFGIHNLGYWLGHDYLGVGPGAHGRTTTSQGVRKRTVRVRLIYSTFQTTFSYFCWSY